MSQLVIICLICSYLVSLSLILTIFYIIKDIFFVGQRITESIKMVKIVDPPLPKSVIPQGIPASGHKTSLYDKNKNHENNFFKWYMNHKNSGSELVFLFDSIGIDKDISLSVNFQKSFSHKFAYLKKKLLHLYQTNY